MQQGYTLPRIAAAHDLSGFGKCALTIALPVLSACGVEVCPLPTAVLSANTSFQGFTLLDFTPHMEGYIRHWAELGLRFDAFYSGFLGSEHQIHLVRDLISRFSPGRIIIDPVMADHGKVYKTYTSQMCESMKMLAAIADVVTPNYTEACILANEPYQPDQVSCADISRLADKIAALGAKSVIITGIERGGALLNCVLDEQGYQERSVPLLPYHMHGTGDLFASVLSGGLVRGHSLYQSVDSAAAFVHFAMEKSKLYADYNRRGTCFEPYLHLLRTGLFSNNPV
ncbi:MAG: pyridoxamine kinase [Christensenellales bacterium]|jgi:pyridoxine kinase